MSDPFKSLLAAAGMVLMPAATDVHRADARYQVAKVVRDVPEGTMEVHELALVHALQVFLSLHKSSARVYDFLQCAMALFAEARKIDPEPYWWRDLP
jgi:hypothetical protein